MNLESILITAWGPGLIFLFSLAGLIWSADKLVLAATALGKRMGVSQFVIGALVIGLGTSLPELSSSLAAVLQSTAENDLTPIIVANVMGSNVANTAALGVAGLIATLSLQHSLQEVDIPLLFVASGLFVMMALDETISRGEALLLVLLIPVFLLSTLNETKKDESLFHRVFGDEDEAPNPQKEDESPLSSVRPLGLITFILIAGALLILSSSITITSLEYLAPQIGISKDVAGLALLALGTSLPELIVSALAVARGNSSIALGNILGSNIVNILVVGGVSGLFGALTVGAESLSIGLPFFIIATGFFLFAALDDRFKRYEGMIALTIYAGFVMALTGVL